MTSSPTKLLVFLSGKGGSGKTTVAISLARLLSATGHRCLLIDFDLATNGASYFFRDRFQPGTRGYWERLGDDLTAGVLGDSIIITDVSTPITIEENFYFYPSRTDFEKKGPSFDSLKVEYSDIGEALLAPTIEWCVEHSIEYCIVDCQAGYSRTSAAAANISRDSGRAVIVSEPDAISSDAADNLLIQMGNVLPRDRKYLINKIDVRDADTYRTMKEVFQQLNRLPPLPFDFAVRNAFGGRRIPVELDTASPLLFALFEMAMALMPELYESLSSYRRGHVEGLFREYDEELQGLIRRRKLLEEEQNALKQIETRGKIKLFRRSIYIASILLVVYMQLDLISFLYPSQQVGETFKMVLKIVPYVAILAVFLLGSLYWGRYLEQNGEASKVAEIERELRRVNADIEQYRSLLWARSKEFLVDAEIGAGRGREMEEGSRGRGAGPE